MSCSHTKHEQVAEGKRCHYLKSQGGFGCLHNASFNELVDFSSAKAKDGLQHFFRVLCIAWGTAWCRYIIHRATTPCNLPQSQCLTLRLIVRCSPSANHQRLRLWSLKDRRHVSNGASRISLLVQPLQQF